MVRALRLSARPPGATAAVPAETATALAEAAGTAMTADIAPDRWATVLDAVAYSSVRRAVNPAGVPVWDVADCPRDLPTGVVALRSGWQTAVALTWSGRRRDRTCVQATEPVEPGTYELRAAVVGGEPASSDFEVTAPRRQT